MRRFTTRVQSQQLPLTCFTQPYYRESSKTVRTVLQTVRLRTSGSKDDDKISKGKQRSAFPPNFVHSLDSTHLLLTALEFHRRGGTFAGLMPAAFAPLSLQRL